MGTKKDMAEPVRDWLRARRHERLSLLVLDAGMGRDLRAALEAIAPRLVQGSLLLFLQAVNTGAHTTKTTTDFLF